MARSGLFPDITRASQAVVKIVAGRELGIGPFAAMSDIHLIDGSPVVGARILAALVRQSGVYDYRVVEWTNERCAIDFFRHGEKRAMSNGVGLHCPELTAGTPLYTPEELGAEDPDVAVAVEPAPQAADAPPEIDEEPRSGAAGTAEGYGGVNADLVEAALEGRYGAATVVELSRFYYDQPSLTALDDEQAADMAGRLRLARAQGVGDERLARVAAKGMTMSDRPRAREAGDIWLTFKGSGGPEAAAA